MANPITRVTAQEQSGALIMQLHFFIRLHFGEYGIIYQGGLMGTPPCCLSANYDEGGGLIGSALEWEASVSARCGV